MRAQGLGVVVAIGPGSIFAVGDAVSGAWGKFNHTSFSAERYLLARHDRVCGDERRTDSETHVR